MELVGGIKGEKDQCFQEFSGEVPNQVKQERALRRRALQESSSKKGLRKQSAALLSPTGKIEFDPLRDSMDMYEMLAVNCKFKKPIKKLLKSVERVRMAKVALEDKHGGLKGSLSKLKSPPVYQPVKGDPVDELFATHLNASGLAIPVKRMASGKYMFGTKQILAKIINGKLVIRVGGGYMSAEEFIETYGRIELMKMQKAEELNQSSANGTDKLSQSMSGKSLKAGAGKMDGKPAMGMAEMKQMMKESLMDVKLYGDKSGGLDARRQSTKVNLAGLEKDFDIPKFGRDNAGSTTSFKSSRTSITSSGVGSLKPPTSLKTPTAASYSSIGAGLKAATKNNN